MKTDAVTRIKGHAKYVLGIHRFQALRKHSKWDDGYMAGLEYVHRALEDETPPVYKRPAFYWVSGSVLAIGVALVFAFGGSSPSPVAAEQPVAPAKVSTPPVNTPKEVHRGISFGEMETDVGGSTHVPVIIHNGGSKTKDYVLTLELLSNGVRVSETPVVATNVAPGQTVQVEGIFLFATGDSVRVTQEG